MYISKETTYETWKNILSQIYKKGQDFKDHRNRICREILNVNLEIQNPEKDITKPIDRLNKFQIWKYPPLEEIENIILSRHSIPDYKYSYGPRLFNFNQKIDQVNDFLIPLLKKDLLTRRAVLCVWDPLEDSNIENKESPGLALIDIKLRNNKLNLTTIIRSNDIFFGWPANIYQLFALQKYIQKRINCKIGKLSTFSTSAHIYEDQFPYIKKILDK